MKRLTLILCGVLVFQVALSAFVLWPRSTASGAGAGSPLLAGFAANDISGLTIYDKPDTSLKLKKAGDKWVLPDADDYPADGAKVDALLKKIAALKTNRLVSQTESSQARLQVAADNYVHRVDLQSTGGSARTLFIGSSAGARATHVRAGDQNAVYLADDLTASDASAQPDQWVDALYFNVPAADVTGFTLNNANGSFKFSKGQGDLWLLDGLQGSETLNKDSVTGLLSLATALRLSKPLGKTEKPEYGLGQRAAELTVTTRKDNQEKTYTLRVGRAKDPADNSYVIKSSESPYFVRAAEYSVKDLVERKREGFLQPPPTPAAQGNATPNPFTFGTPGPGQ